MKNDDLIRNITICPIDAPLVQYLVMDDQDNNKPVGYLLATVAEDTKNGFNYKKAAIWHIHVEHGKRKMGYAKSLVAALKVTFNEIVSQVQTKEGNCLLTSAGFVVEKIDGIEYRIWRKP
jgi:hypothetical protein